MGRGGTPLFRVQLLCQPPLRCCCHSVTKATSRNARKTKKRMVFMGPSFFFIFWRSFAPGDRHPSEVVVTIANSSFKSRRAKRVSSRNSYGRYESFALQR